MEIFKNQYRLTFDISRHIAVNFGTRVDTPFVMSK